MSKLIAAAMVRLDGVMQAPGGPDEDAPRCAGPRYLRDGDVRTGSFAND